MVNLALAWAESYRQVQPEVDIAVTGGGSGTGIAALINGTVDIANASREMKEQEIEDARANGIDPVETVVAVDALAVIVNKANAVNQLSVDQLADIFTGRVTNWKELGGNDAPIVLVSREDQFRHPCLFPGRGGAQRRQGEQGRLCAADPVDAFLRRHYERGAAEPECHWL